MTHARNAEGFGSDQAPRVFAGADIVTLDSRPESSGYGRGGQVPASADVRDLSEAECRDRLRLHSFGRIAIVTSDGPRIFPVNYAFADDNIVFRTEPGTKLRYGPGSIGCFEIDGYDELGTTGWSVMAVGPIDDVTGGEDERARSLLALPLRAAAPGRRQFRLALQARELTGRSFRGGWVLPTDG